MPVEPITRKRDVPFEGRALSGHSTIFVGGTLIDDVRASLVPNGRQITVSEGHQVSLLGKTDEDIGGDFYTTKVSVEQAGQWIDVAQGTYPGFTYQGDAGAVNPNDWNYHPPDLSYSKEELEALGSTAVSLVSPVDSQAELLTAIAEAAREGMPSLPGAQTWADKTRIAKGAGSEYLNAQFGWVPLVSEIGNLVEANRKAVKLIRQLERDNGRNVRRTFRFQDEKKTETVLDQANGGNGIPWTVTPFHAPLFQSNPAGRLVIEREFRRKMKFSGCFTYHLPTGDTRWDNFLNALQKYDRLYGVAPTPDVLWNLTPWSWAVDWFANIGDVINNASNALLYGQILRYGYMMEETTVIDTYTRYCPNVLGATTVFTTRFKRVTKKRVKASPFGFGLSFDGFDAYQLSILAALGISRR